MSRVVRPDALEPDERTWERQLADLGGRLLRWTGWRAGVIDMSRREAVQGLADGEPYLVEAAREGWLISGEALGDLAESPE